MLYYGEIFVRKEVKWRFPIRLAGTVRGVVGAVLDLFRSPNIDEFDFVVVVKVNKTVYLQLVSVFFRLFFVFFFCTLKLLSEIAREMRIGYFPLLFSPNCAA